MAMAVGPAALPPADGGSPPAMGPTMMPMTVVPDAVAKDAIIGWYRGEFAAANAIIDALCGHLTQLSGGGADYGAVFAAIHRRRMNWIPVLQMQKYHSIADVTVELRNLGAKMAERESHHQNGDVFEAEDNCKSSEGAKSCVEDEKVEETNGNEPAADEVTEEDGSPESDITDSGSQEVLNSVNTEICSNHDDCEARRAQIKLTKGFSAKESVKGHMVNVVKGLKLYEEIFTDSELSKLTDFANELRTAGLNGELSGETFILFNKQIKGNRRELIQFGIPIFGQVKDESASNIGPIPALLHDVIDHLVLWQLIPEYKRPNGCIINFFEEGEYSQPFLKPPHLDQPISTLLLSESTMAFGRTLVTDTEGNYKGPLTLSLKEGSLLVMRGNSADMARHVMCPSPNKRISITFFRVRVDSNQFQSSPPSPTPNGAMTVWQHGVMSPYAAPDGAPNGYEAMDVMPKWGVLRAPVVMLAPVRPMVVSPRKVPQSGTGVFLPWTVGSRKPAKHLPPRAQKGRLMALPSPAETHVVESTSEPGITV
ncbi:putative oxoglutarate/iron-dependent dioxygenase, alpha-ketoglutarate-dependent dioxygenase AlkB [Rosa chinensis]|uniref:Putative oxoglutarate/iron-dependent dioxygenase, alpha-ketoglutarate-dependent dioxygenase AlkB n=1 Tax=Rosa chinensis TaxID=74649 RepID=A0A2P6PW81_ROSCH|nr:RNA demethylase ALKBH10B [Rosa chinensis]PRQ26192.1 putative oxoglutarate/iron-dependent dioxygenase, alpha-ketoglutarate-dependent dioxygenase AlkB [Rosa chinensis]